MISGMSRADVKNVLLIMHTDSVILGSSLIHNAEFAVDLSPVPNAHSPFFSSFEVARYRVFRSAVSLGSTLL